MPALEPALAWTPSRALVTVMMTDVVASTARAVALGDGRWREVVESHDRIARATIATFRGRYVKSLGDGLLATFDSPACAIASAQAFRDALSKLNLSVRIGLHTGNVEFLGDDIIGVTVNITGRICAAAGGNEILVSGTVRDLMGAPTPQFCDRGTHRLKGIPDWWALYALCGDRTRSRGHERPANAGRWSEYQRSARLL